MTTLLRFFTRRHWPQLLAALLLGNGPAQAQTTAYCAMGLGGSCGGNDITNVSLSGTTLNATGLSCASTGGQAYTSYPATGTTTGTVSGGVPYTLSVTLTGSSIVSVWVDYNRNFIYEASEWTQVATTSPIGTPASVTLLVPATAVQGTTGMRIRSRGASNPNTATNACTFFGSGETKDFTLTIGAPAACPSVSGLVVSGITASGATVSFTPASAATTYTVTVTPAGGMATTQTVTASPIVLTGLTASTGYTVSIVGNCGAGSTSAANAITFSTGCTSAPYAPVTNTTAYTQDFETTWLNLCDTRDAPDANWRGLPLTGNNAWRRDDDGPSAAWSGTSGAYTPAGSPLGAGPSLHSARFHSYSTPNGTRGTLDLAVNMAGTSGTPTLSFDYINVSGTDSLKVLVSTNGGTSFSPVLLGLTTASAWTRKTVNLPATGLTATTIIRLRATGDFGVTDIGVDNVRVSYVSCPAVTAVTATGITATGATVSFTPASAATTYTVTVTPAGGTATTQTVTASPIVLTGLTASTGYTVSIVGNCGAGSTSQPTVVTFSTACLAAPYAMVTNTTAYTQDFEATWLNVCDTRDAPDANWRGLPLTGNNAWRRDDDGPSAAWSGTSGAYTPAGSPLGTGPSLHSARFHSYSTPNGTRGTLDLAVNMAGTVGTPTLEFDYINASGTDSLKVLVSTNGGTSFSPVLLGLTTTATWTRQTILLPTSLTATSIVRLRATSDFGFSDIGVDNVRVSYVACAAVTNLTTSGITATGAVLNFTPPIGPTTYTVTVTPAGGTATIITPAPSAAPITLTNLTPNTAYTVSVVSNCSSSTTSTATTTTFTTSCTAPSYVLINNATPYNQDFEATWASQCGTNDIPGVNWRNTPTSGNNSWRREDDGPSAAWSGPTLGAYTPTGSPLGTGPSLHSARFHSYNVAGRARGSLDLYGNMTGTSGTPALSFDYINTSGTDSLKVFVSTNGGTTFSAALAGFGQSGTWTRQTVNLPGTGLTATTVIRLRAVGDLGSTDIGLDNVNITYLACPTVTGLSATGVTPTTATVNFTPGPAATTYTVTVTPAGGATTTQTATTSPVNLTGLTPGTSYTITVVSNCGAGQTSPTATFTFTTSPVAPVNDECVGALDVPIQFGTCTTQTTADNTAATTSAGAPTPSCSTTLNRDVWFKVTVPVSGSVTVKTVAPTAGSNIMDTVITLYSGTCANLVEIGCNDDTNGPYSQVALTGRTPGEVLYIRAWSYGSATSGLIAVCATAPSNCAAPSGPTAANVTNTTATLNWLAPTGGLPAGNTYELEYGVQGFTQGTGTSVTGLTAATYALTNLQAATTYCFYVRQNCGTVNGSSTFVGPTCFTTPLTAPANDEPCGAVALGTTTVTGSNVGATTSVQNGINTPACSPAALPKDVWFSFTATATTRTLTVTGTVAGMVRVFTTPSCSAGPFNQVFCQAAVGNNLNVGSARLTGLTVGTVYYVAVSGYGSSDTTGSFTILSLPTATSAQANTDALLVYPNPSNTGTLTLRLSGLSAAGQATLFNALGQAVATKVLSGTAEQTLSTRSLATGLYTLRVTVAGQVLTRKVVLE